MAGLKDTEVRPKVLKIKEEELGLDQIVIICRTEKNIEGINRSGPRKIYTNCTGRQMTFKELC